MNDPEKLPTAIQTLLLFGARYTHHRNTGGTLAAVNALKQCWHQLSERVQQQILNESEEATTNKEDWEELRKFVKKYEK